MKKLLILLFLIFSNYIYSSEIYGNIYNLEKRGSGYSGSLEARIFSHKKDLKIKINPSKNVEILNVNGDKDENNIYLIKKETIRVDFIYKAQINSIEDKIVLGRVEYLDEVGKNELLIGNIAVEFRKIGKIEMSVSGEMDFGVINSRVPKNGVDSKKNPEITIDLDIDKKDVGNTKLYFEYPEQIKLGNGQIFIKIETQNKTNYTTKVAQSGETVNIISFIPNREKTKEKIRMKGRLYSTVPIIKPGEYSEKVRVKAFYEYLDYSIENKTNNKKVVIRR